MQSSRGSVSRQESLTTRLRHTVRMSTAHQHTAQLRRGAPDPRSPGCGRRRRLLSPATRWRAAFIAVVAFLRLVRRRFFLTQRELEFVRRAYSGAEGIASPAALCVVLQRCGVQMPDREVSELLELCRYRDGHLLTFRQFRVFFQVNKLDSAFSRTTTHDDAQEAFRAVALCGGCDATGAFIPADRIAAVAEEFGLQLALPSSELLGVADVSALVSGRSCAGVDIGGSGESADWWRRPAADELWWDGAAAWEPESGTRRASQRATQEAPPQTSSVEQLLQLNFSPTSPLGWSRPLADRGGGVMSPSCAGAGGRSGPLAPAMSASQLLHGVGGVSLLLSPAASTPSPPTPYRRRVAPAQASLSPESSRRHRRPRSSDASEESVAAVAETAATRTDGPGAVAHDGGAERLGLGEDGASSSRAPVDDRPQGPPRRSPPPPRPRTSGGAARSSPGRTALPFLERMDNDLAGRRSRPASAAFAPVMGAGAAALSPSKSASRAPFRVPPERSACFGSRPASSPLWRETQQPPAEPMPLHTVPFVIRPSAVIPSATTRAARDVRLPAADAPLCDKPSPMMALVVERMPAAADVAQPTGAACLATWTKGGVAAGSRQRAKDPRSAKRREVPQQNRSER